MENIIISACLVGIDCKYNGKNNYSTKVLELMKKYNLILICPEYFGGLSIPRDPSEIKGSKVISIKGKDVTVNYVNGSLKALELAKENNCTKAILKEKSPSCGKYYTYDGSFSSKVIKRAGITTQLFIKNNIDVYN